MSNVARPRRILTVLSDYIYEFEYLSYGKGRVYGLRLKSYCDSLFDYRALFPHIVCSKTGMLVTDFLICCESTEN